MKPKINQQSEDYQKFIMQLSTSHIIQLLTHKLSNYSTTHTH